jgi:hypothetical protein
MKDASSSSKANEIKEETDVWLACQAVLADLFADSFHEFATTS